MRLPWPASNSSRVWRDVGRLARLAAFPGWRGRAPWSTTPAPLGQAEHVEDQGDPAVAHDGGARERGDALQLLAERLDDDLLGVVDLVDHEPERMAVGLQDDDVDGGRVGVGLSPSFSSRFR